MNLIDCIRMDLRANSSKKEGRIGFLTLVAAYLLNPGFSVVCNYRIGSELAARKWRLASKLFWLRNVKGYGVYISTSAVIGPGLCLPHPVGVVIGEGVCIGAGVRIYQGVTLGRRNLQAITNPSVGDRVVIYAGAVIVGGVAIPADSAVPAQSFIK